MNKLAKKMAKREGFTLVELIVVIAILGILAGIAIPVYSGYIAQAQQAADMQVLDSVKTAAVFAAVDTDVNAKVTAITVGSVPQTVTITATGTTKTMPTDISDYVGEDTEFKYVTAASWNADDGWTITSHK